AHFGLGDATVINLIRVEWPSGAVQEFTNATIDRTLVAIEPPRLAVIQASNAIGFELTVIGATGFDYAIEASTNWAHWMPIATFTNCARVTSFTDSDAINYAQRFYRAVWLGTWSGAGP